MRAGLLCCTGPVKLENDGNLNRLWFLCWPSLYHFLSFQSEMLPFPALTNFYFSVTYIQQKAQML